MSRSSSWPGLSRASLITSARLLAGRPGRATSTIGAVFTRPTGARSFSASYFTAAGFTRRAIAIGLSAPITSVYPSGAAAAARATPMAPPAPATLSTTTDCLSRSDSFCATSRAATSTLPPAL